MSRQRKKAYLSIVSVSIIYFTLIAYIINDCRQITQEYVNEYKLHIEKISNLEDDPITLAEEFMQTEYDKHWDSLKGCWGGTPRDKTWDYQLDAYIISGRYATCFYRDSKDDTNALNEFPEGVNTLIRCYANANDKPDSHKTVMISFYYNSNYPNIAGHVDYHGDNPPEQVFFSINLEENRYISDKPNLKELTGLTIEEIVETAELNRKGFEDLMYTMKEHELEESKNDLNSGLKHLYTIAALLIIALLTLWITVLVAMIKSKSNNKKQVRFHSKLENKPKNKRTHLLAIFVSLIYIALITEIINEYRLETENHVRATLMVVVLLTLWITVLTAILKSISSNKNRRTRS